VDGADNGGVTMAGPAMLLFADYDAVSVKDSRFGAAGDGATDDTAALQAALDHCFGAADAPHGTSNVHQNKALWLPPGHYKTTAPLTLTYLHGARIIGAGRFVTRIENVTPGASVFVTNGCGYSRFEGMRLTAASGAKSFDLDWDGSAGGPALQSNTFRRHVLRWRLDRRRDRAFRLHGQRDPVSQLLLARQTTAGLVTSNPNALQQTVIGGNFQGCNRAIFAGAGSVPTIHGVGFQLSGDCDIYTGTLSDNSMSVQGCRSESVNFVNNAGGQLLHVGGCARATDISYRKLAGSASYRHAARRWEMSFRHRGRRCGSKTVGSRATTGCCSIPRICGGSRTTTARSAWSWRT
jgi:hypothetical protein